MWRPTSIADQMPEDLSANLAQLRHSTLQRLILTSAGFYLLPVILVFLFMQRYFVEGIAGAVKQ